MNHKDKVQSFKNIINENKGILYKVINTYCKDHKDRNDLEQEILIQLWKSFDKYNSDFKITTWMYRIAMNVSISFYRKNKKKPVNLSIDSIFIENNYVEKTDETNDNSRLLYFFINQLNKLDKAIILLYLEEYNYKEISEIMGITETNVSSKINRIKNRLKKNYQNGIK